MNSSSNDERGARFLRRVQQVGELNVTVLASSKFPSASSESSTLAAKRLIGALPGQQAERVNRLAAKLDKLVAADREAECLRKQAIR